MTTKIHDRNHRGRTKIGWLDSYHTFSFGEFRDPGRMGFRSLRVINEDFVVPGAGFPTHPHEDMEIITYVLDGHLAHKDSMGNGSVIGPGEVQKMSAGTGVTHSEYNHSNEHPAHFIQIWIRPDKRGVSPDYAQIKVDDAAARKGFLLIAANGKTGNVVPIHQDVSLYVARPRAGDVLSHDFASGRHGFIQVTKGAFEIDGNVLKQGDGLQVSDVSTLRLMAQSDAEVLLFDLA